VIGVGASVYDLFNGLGYTAHPMHAAEKSDKTDASGKLGFFNKRAEWWWQLREALDPARGATLALPPDAALKADLTAPLWEMRGPRILVESKETIRERLGRSTNRADAVLLALNAPQSGWLLWEG
jgi:hypothetical protein